MTRNAKKIQSIEEVKRRDLCFADSINSKAWAIERQLDAMLQTCLNVSMPALELWKYFPIAAVTCLENSVRWSIGFLIDFKPEFEVNASQLVAGQFSLADLMPLIGRRITLGDLVAHLVSVNNLHDITSQLSTLLGRDSNGKSRDFLAELKAATTFDEKIFGSIPPEEDSLLLPHPEKTIPTIQRLFEIRHVLVHELTAPDTISSEEVAELLQETSTFISAMHQFIHEQAIPGFTAQCQAATNAGAAIRLQESEQEMERTFAELSEQLEAQADDKRRLLEAQDRWKAYYQAEASFYINPFGTGTGAPMMYAGFCRQLVVKRKQELQEHLDQLKLADAALLW